MNAKNVAALAAVFREAMVAKIYDGDTEQVHRQVAEFMAARGCLGPASSVLTEKEIGDLSGYAAHAEERGKEVKPAHIKQWTDWLEGIAKGETP